MVTKEMPREVPVADLRPGFTVWQEGPRGYIRDVYLADYFVGGYSPSEFMRRVQFVTGNRDSESIVMWHKCGTVLVTDGRDERKVINRGLCNAVRRKSS